MIAERDEAEVMDMGSRFTGAELLEQYAQTTAVATADPDVAALAASLLAESQTCAGSAKASLADRSVAQDEARGASGQVAECVADLRAWNRELAGWAAIAELRGADVAPTLTHRQIPAGSASRVAATVTQRLSVANAGAATAVLVAAGMPADLLDRGKALVAALEDAGQNRHRTRAADLPEKVRAFRLQKGLLYLAIRELNEIGRIVHSADPIRSAQYNLSILYRKTGASAPQPPQPAPVA